MEPSFDLYNEVLKSFPTWIQLHNLPVSFGSSDSLSRISSVVGLPRCDDCKTKQKRLNYSRILVAIDVTIPRVTEVNIESVDGSVMIKNCIMSMDFNIAKSATC